MVDSLGDGILPHVAPPSVELHAVVRDLVVEVRCPGGITKKKQNMSKLGLEKRRGLPEAGGQQTKTALTST